jgi:hypothetical protein
VIREPTPVPATPMHMTSLGALSPSYFPVTNFSHLLLAYRRHVPVAVVLCACLSSV